MFRPANPLPEAATEDQRGLSTIDSEQVAAKQPTRPIEPTDAELLMRFERHGDEAAFAELVQRHGPMVMAVCRQSLRQQSDAEDAFQAVWIVLLGRGRAIRNRASLGGWLYRVAHRTALRAARRRHRRREVTMQEEHSDTRDPLEAVRRHSLVRSLLDEVDQLPDRYREPLVLVYLEGKSYAQAASELECTAATVRGRLTRGKRLLRTRLLRQGVSLASAMAVAGVAMAPETALAEMTHLVELASTAASATSGAAATGSAGTSSAGNGAQITIADTTISLAEEGMRTMLFTSMTTKMAATALVLCASVSVWTLQSDNYALADSGDGAQPVLIAQADGETDAASVEANVVVESAGDDVLTPRPAQPSATGTGYTRRSRPERRSGRNYEPLNDANPIAEDPTMGKPESMEGLLRLRRVGDVAHNEQHVNGEWVKMPTPRGRRP